MKINDALEFADAWSKGLTIYDGCDNPRDWRVACMVLAAEVRKQRRGEFICKKCGLRKNAEQDHGPEF